MPQSLEPLTAAIYDAALDPAAWPQVMRGLRTRFRTAAETFYMLDFDTQQVRAGYLAGIAPRWYDCFPQLYFTPDNPWQRHSPELHRLGVVRTHTVLVAHTRDPDVLLRSQYYNEWLAPQDLHYSLGSTLTDERRAIANISLMRHRGEPEFDRSDISDFQRLSRHFVRARQLARRLDGLATQRRQIAEVLDHVRDALILLDAHARVLHVNAAGQRLLDVQDSLRLCEGRLACRHPADQQHLDALTLALRRDGPAMTPPAPFMLNSLPSGPAWTVTATPLRLPVTSELQAQNLLLLTVAQPPPPPHPPVGLLQQRYGLTPAEARLAVALLEGARLRDAAAALSITYGTARERLKGLFQKTGTHRQPELLSRLLRDATTSTSTGRTPARH